MVHAVKVIGEKIYAMGGDLKKIKGICSDVKSRTYFEKKDSKISNEIIKIMLNIFLERN